MEVSNQNQSQIFVKLLDGKTRILRFAAPQVTADAIKHRLFQITKIPTHLQSLVLGFRHLHDDSVVSHLECTVHLLLPLRGGKGGFGSLLRGAATKAGQKKTSNFDACRDMSGRRLRHVNAEKKLEEWKAEEDERRLEKIAEEFIKKKAKKGKQGVGDGEAAKYVQKYREESARCVAEVEESVREAIMGKNGKRKKVALASVGKSDAKRLKIWTGKRILGESDSDSSDSDSSGDDEGEENEKSIVLNNGSNSDSSKEDEGVSGSAASGKQELVYSAGAFCEGSSDEEKETVVQVSLESGASAGSKAAHDKVSGVTGSVVEEDKIVQDTNVTCTELEPVSVTEAIKVDDDCKLSEFVNQEQVGMQQLGVLSSGKGDDTETSSSVSGASGSSESRSTGNAEVEAASTTEAVKPLNFDEYNSAAELEVLGMERLKTELQARGLKCGGTLQERAARLFLLKSIPVEKLPKKLFSKK